MSSGKAGCHSETRDQEEPYGRRPPSCFRRSSDARMRPAPHRDPWRGSRPRRRKDPVLAAGSATQTRQLLVGPHEHALQSRARTRRSSAPARRPRLVPVGTVGPALTLTGYRLAAAPASSSRGNRAPGSEGVGRRPRPARPPLPGQRQPHDRRPASGARGRTWAHVCSADTDFARFGGVTCLNPLAGA